MVELSPNEKKVLLAIRDENATPGQIMEKTGLEMVAVMSAASWLKSKGLVKINEKIMELYTLDTDGKEYLKTGLPEKRIMEKMENGKIEMKKLFKEMDKKYQKADFNKVHILKSLVYFADADLQPMPKMCRKISWEEIKSLIISKATSFRI